MERPFVVINVAASVDGKIDTFERRGAAISSEADRARVDALRAGVDAVMVGSRTLLGEDPRLIVRSADLRAERVQRGLPENPAKVGVVSDLRLLRPDARFLTAGPARIIIFAAARRASSPAGAAWLAADSGDRQEDVLSTSGWSGHRRAGVVALHGRQIEVFFSETPRVDLRAALQTLWGLGLRRVLVEGGGSLNFELFRLGLVDELQLYLAPLIFGGATAPTLADGDGLPRGAALKLLRTAVEPDADGGVLLRYKVEAS